MQFNPEDGHDFGPHCRNCHKGASACGTCHGLNGTQGSVPVGWAASYARFTTNEAIATSNTPEWSTLDAAYTTDSQNNEVAGSGTFASGLVKQSRTVTIASDWRTSAAINNTNCSDDGFSWPHRTMGWKMLKDDLFGLDITGAAVAVGQTRSVSVGGGKAHDIDSVCLDCHNPTIWNASSALDHNDDPSTTADDYDDELLLRGLP